MFGAQLDHLQRTGWRALSLDELSELARRGEVTDAKTLIGLSWLREWQADRWPLAWQAQAAAPTT